MTPDHMFDSIQEMTDATLMSRGYLLTFCPWHSDSHASLLVYPDGWYHCLAECGSGRIERLYEELSNPGVIRRPNGKNGFARPPKLPTELEDIDRLVWRAHDALKRNDEFTWYLKLRGVEDRIETAKLGYYDGWIVIPVFTEKQKVRGVYMRATPPQEKVTGLRFIQPVGQHPMLYCPEWRLWKSSPSVAVVFGAIDALVLSSLGFPVITTTGGSKSFDPAWLNDWRKPVYVIPDRDGDDKATADLVAALGWRGKIIRLPYDDYDGISDPADFAKENINKKNELAKLIASAL